MFLSTENDAFAAFLSQADREALALHRAVRRLYWAVAAPPMFLLFAYFAGAPDHWYDGDAIALAATLSVLLWLGVDYGGRAWVERGLDLIALRFLDVYPKFADSYLEALEALVGCATASGVETALIARLPGPGDIAADPSPPQ